MLSLNYIYEYNRTSVKLGVTTTVPAGFHPYIYAEYFHGDFLPIPNFDLNQQCLKAQGLIKKGACDKITKQNMHRPSNQPICHKQSRPVVSRKWYCILH